MRTVRGNHRKSKGFKGHLVYQSSRMTHVTQLRYILFLAVLDVSSVRIWLIWKTESPGQVFSLPARLVSRSCRDLMCSTETWLLQKKHHVPATARRLFKNSFPKVQFIYKRCPVEAVIKLSDLRTTWIKFKITSDNQVQDKYI